MLSEKLFDFVSVMFVFVSSVIILFLAKYFKSWLNLYQFASQLDGPKGLPFVGSGLKFLCKNKDLLNVFLGLTTPYVSPSKIWIGPRLMIVVKDPQQLQKVLQSSKITTKADFYRFLEPFLGQGLLTSSDPLHKEHRRLIQPFFSKKMVYEHCSLFQKHANKFVEYIRKHVDGPEFDIMEYLHGSMFESAMDLLLEDKNDHSINYYDAPTYVKRYYKLSFKRLKTFWLHPDFIYQKTSQYKEILKMKEITNNMIDEVFNTTVKKIIQRLQNSDNKNFDEDEIRSPSVLEKLTEKVLSNPKSLSVQHAADHMISLVAASQDTTSSAIAFTCMMLGAYPHIQDLVFKEIIEVLTNKTSFELGDVSKLKYLDMCVKETMRLFAIIPFIFRDTTNEFYLDNLVIPKNVTVAISIYHAHRDPKHWEKPQEFYPEHFAENAVRKRHPFAFLPFSAGPRNCIAQLYSYTNIKICLATILLNYKIESNRKVEDIRLTNDVATRPLGGYRIKICKRI